MKWPVVSLSDTLASAEVFVDGDWVESKDQDPAGDVRLIQLADIGDGSYIDKSARFLTSGKARQLKCTFLKAGDVLVARMPDPLGRACVFPGDSKPSVTVVDVCIVRPNGAHDSRWLMHCINSPTVRNQIASFATGTTRSRISRSNLGKIKIVLPPLSEQRRIAAILDKANEMRAKRRAALSQSEMLGRTIFFDLFGDIVSNSKCWPLYALNEISDEINDCPHSTPVWTNEGEICLRTSNLTEGGWNWEDTRYVSEAIYHERSKRGYLQPGDIVLSREGTVGIAAIVPPNMKMCMGQRLVQVRPILSKVLPEFLLHHLLLVLAPSRIGRIMVGSTSSHLNVKELKTLHVPVPPIEVQQKYALRVAFLAKMKAAQRNSLAQMDALFSSLQHRASRGEL
jgi:type I restriction enzyme S subunit